MVAFGAKIGARRQTHPDAGEERAAVLDRDSMHRVLRARDSLRYARRRCHVHRHLVVLQAADGFSGRHNQMF